METQMLIAALKAQHFVLMQRLSAMAFEDHSDNAVRRDWNITSHQCDQLHIEIKRLEESENPPIGRVIADVYGANEHYLKVEPLNTTGITIGSTLLYAKDLGPL